LNSGHKSCSLGEFLKALIHSPFSGRLSGPSILFCIAGVTVLAFYEGPMFRSFNHHHLFQNGGSSPSGAAEKHSKKQWVLGIFLMTLSNVLAGQWTVLQVRIAFGFQT